MNLNTCTKSDLIWIIERMKRYDPSLHAYNSALSDFKYEKAKRCKAEADKLAKIVHDEQIKYVELLKPYDLERITDIPPYVIEEAKLAIKKARAANIKWVELMKTALN